MKTWERDGVIFSVRPLEAHLRFLACGKDMVIISGQSRGVKAEVTAEKAYLESNPRARDLIEQAIILHIRRTHAEDSSH